MKSRHVSWDRLAPVGQDARRPARWIAAGLAASALWSVLCFLMGYLPRLRRILEAPARAPAMPHFTALLRYTMAGFQTLAALMPPLALYYYCCHYRESRSIYLMRRLPDKGDLRRRCLTLPAFGLLGCGGLSLLLLLAFFAVYQLCTPPEFRAPAEAQEALYRLLCRLFS